MKTRNKKPIMVALVESGSMEEIRFHVLAQEIASQRIRSMRGKMEKEIIADLRKHNPATQKRMRELFGLSRSDVKIALHFAGMQLGFYEKARKRMLGKAGVQ